MERLAQASVKRILEQSDTDIHHGEAMTCTHRAETAECRKEKPLLGLPADDGPDESLCHTTCANLAYTDRDIVEHRRRLPVLETEARDPMTPRPHQGPSCRTSSADLRGDAVVDGRPRVAEDGPPRFIAPTCGFPPMFRVRGEGSYSSCGCGGSPAGLLVASAVRSSSRYLV